MTNPLAGHTAAAGMNSDSEGLRDGDGLSSPSLTNPYEGIHGNGILRISDTAVGSSLRNSISASTPGFIETAASGVVTIHGGWCVLDGALYKFAGGPGATQQITIGDTGTANFNGELPSVPTNTSLVFVVIYVCSDSSTTNRIRYEMGTPVAPSNGTPLIPSSFLADPSIGNSRSNHQSMVLGVLRYVMTGGAANVTASLDANPILHDRRVYIRSSPLYLQHLTKGGKTTGTGFSTPANSIDSHTDLAAVFSSPESSDFANSEFGAIWQSHTPDQHSMLYYAASKTLNGTKAMHTHRLGPNELSIITANTSFTFDQANIWLINPNGGSAHATLTPSGTFPPGHAIEIRNISTSGSYNAKFNAKTNNASAADVDIANGKYAKFAYDGAAWHFLSSGDLTYTDAEAIAAVEGESTLVLQSGVTVGTDLKLSTSSDDVIIENVTQDKDIIFKANDGGASTEIMRIDADVARVGIGLNNPSGKLHVKTTDVNYAALFETTDDSASAAPDVALYRNSATPTNGDDLGHLIWRGVTTDDDPATGGAPSQSWTTLTRANYADIFCEAQIATTGAESGKMHLRTKVAGTMKKRISIAATETIVNEDAQNTDLRIESTGNQNMIRDDASADKVGIGHAPSTIDATLDILTGGTFRNTRLLTVSVSASTTLTEAAHAGRYNICAGNITLPSTSTAGEYYTILNTTGGNITIGRNGNNINGAGADYTLATFKIATCIAIGSNNWIVSD